VDLCRFKLVLSLTAAQGRSLLPQEAVPTELQEHWHFLSALVLVNQGVL
jgi:hypothetical protein